MLVLGTNIWYKSTHNNNIFFHKYTTHPRSVATLLIVIGTTAPDDEYSGFGDFFT
jgi:hypothetical protein